jgi:hypothetical protein
MLGDLASRREPLSTSLSRGRAILVDALLLLNLVSQGLLLGAEHDERMRHPRAWET